MLRPSLGRLIKKGSGIHTAKDSSSKAESKAEKESSGMRLSSSGMSLIRILNSSEGLLQGPLEVTLALE